MNVRADRIRPMECRTIGIACNARGACVIGIACNAIGGACDAIGGACDASGSGARATRPYGIISLNLSPNHSPNSTPSNSAKIAKV
jgi:hypothetical protein